MGYWLVEALDDGDWDPIGYLGELDRAIRHARSWKKMGYPVRIRWRLT